VDPFSTAGVAMAASAIYVVLLTPFLLLSLALPYIVLRLRDQQGLERDPQVGLKAALYFFFSLGILLVLSGLTVIAVDMVQDKAQPRLPGAPLFQPPEETMNPARRTGWAMMVAGAFIVMVHFVLIKSTTNDKTWPAARRVFVGWRFGIHGILVVAVFTAWLIVLFQKDYGPKDVRKNLLAILAVWFPSWLIHLILLAAYSKIPDQPRRSSIETNPFVAQP
jgi:hypothetical protein